MARKKKKISSKKDIFETEDFDVEESNTDNIETSDDEIPLLEDVPDPELLKEDGSANQTATGSPSYFLYVLKGNGPETWQPRFTYYGFRYLQVEGQDNSTSFLLPRKTQHVPAIPQLGK